MAKRGMRRQSYVSLERCAGDALEGTKSRARAEAWVAARVKKVRDSGKAATTITGEASASKCWAWQIVDIDNGAFATFSTTARGRCLGLLVCSRVGFLIPRITRKNAAIRMACAIRRFLFIRLPKDRKSGYV